MKFGEKFVIVSKKFYGGSIYNEKYLKTKIKSYNGKTYTNFHINKMPKEGVFSLFFLSVILIDSVCRICKIYYLLVFLGDLNMLLKKKRCLSILLTANNFLLVILMEKTLMNKILLKKIKLDLWNDSFLHIRKKLLSLK